MNTKKEKQDENEEKESNDSDDAQENDNGQFLQGKIKGTGEIKYKNGSTYKGLLRGNKRHGRGTMNFVAPLPRGDKNDVGEFFGNWKRDKRDGFGVMKYINGDTFEGIWKEDKM